MENDFDLWSKGFTTCLNLLDDKHADVEEYLSGIYDWEILGARDAIDYYKMCEGQYEFLVLAGERSWQEKHYNKIYTPNPKFDPDNFDGSDEIIDV